MIWATVKLSLTSCCGFRQIVQEGRTAGVSVWAVETDGNQAARSETVSSGFWTRTPRSRVRVESEPGLPVVTILLQQRTDLQEVQRWALPVQPACLPFILHPSFTQPLLFPPWFSLFFLLFLLLNILISGGFSSSPTLSSESQIFISLLFGFIFQTDPGEEMRIQKTWIKWASEKPWR